MKRFLVSATAAAVLSALSSGAFAVVNLDDGKTPNNYAKELVVAGTTPLAGAAVDVTSTLGFGVSGSQTRFVRYDLTNAKFKAAVDPTDLSISGAAFANVVISQGGAAGDTYVIFQVTAAAAGNAQTETLSFASGSGASTGLVIQSAAASVQMAYSLYETGSAAAAGGAAGRLNSNFAAQTVAGLVSGLSFSAITNKTTVDVAATPAYTKFVQGVTGTSTQIAQIGTVSIGAATGVLTPAGAAVVYSDLVAATGTKLVLKGDFSGAVSPATANTGLFLGTDNGDCGTGNIKPTPDVVVGGAANFVTDVTPAVKKPLCFTVAAANATAVSAQTFTIEADVAPKANTTTADQPPIDAGTFVRNGTVLKAAFAETTGASGVSRAVSLSNTSNLDAPYTVRCLVNSSTTVAGNPGTLAKNSSSRLSLTGASGLGCPSNGTLRGVVLTFQSVQGNVVGSLISQNTATGQASYDGMTGNQ